MYATYRNLLALKAQVSERTVYARAHYAVIGTPLEIPIADFSASPLVVERGNAVQFVDTSYGIITRWRWTIAEQEYTEQNPLVVFDLPAGKYDVTLVAGNDAGESAAVTKTEFIEVVATSPVPDFTAYPLTVEKGGNVQFSDATVGNVVAFMWNIPGVGTYHTQNPVVLFNVNSGTYNVTLTASNANGEASITKTAYITVTQTLPTADFGSDITQVTQNGYVQFLDKSANAASRLWTIEGIGTFTDENPRVRFPTLGAKDVSLAATNSNGTATRTRGDYINVVAPPPAPSTFRTGVLCCYGTNQSGYDTNIFIENRKSTPLRLTLCMYDANGNALMQPYTVTPNIPAGRLWYASLSYSGIFPSNATGLVVAWDADAPDDGVEGAFAGQWMLYPLGNPPTFYAMNAMTRVPDRRTGRVSVARQIGLLWSTAGFDTAIALWNPNRALQHVPLGSLSGTPQTMAQVAIMSGTFYDVNGTTYYAIDGSTAVFPIKCMNIGLASLGMFVRHSDGQPIPNGSVGQIALTYTGDLLGIEMITDPGMTRYCALFDIQQQFEV